MGHSYEVFGRSYTVSKVLSIISFLSLTIRTVVASCNCGGNFAGLNGSFTSPGYPNNYPNERTCCWLLQCPVGKIVSVLVNIAEIEHDKTCAFDYIKFRDLSSTGPGLLPTSDVPYDPRQDYKFCGSLRNLRWRSTKLRIWVQFKSDDGTTDSGFHATWKCENPPAPTTKIRQTTTTQSTGVITTTKAKTSNAQPRTNEKTAAVWTLKPIPVTAGKTDPKYVSPGLTKVHGNEILTKQIATTATKKPSVTVRSFCYAELYKNINWGSTHEDSYSKRPCASGEKGPVATRKCLRVKGKHAVWSKLVDTSRCVSGWMKGIDDKVTNPRTSALDGITSILNMTLKNSLLGGDIVKIVHHLDDLLKKAEKKDLVNPPKELADSLHKEFVLVGSNILDSNAWNGIPKKKQAPMVTALLKNLENLGLAIGKAQFASYLGNVGHTSAVSPNIVSTTTAINPNVNSSVELFDATFRREAGNMNTDWKMLGQIKIPKAVIKQVTGSKTTCYCSSVTTRNTARLLDPEFDEISDNDAKASFDSNPETVNTFVTSLALSPSTNATFLEPIVIKSKHLQKIQLKKSKTKCSYWNTSQVSPGWSQVGVVTALVTADETECQTYHLTSFAVLMKTGKFEIGAQHKLILKLITQIGLGVSLLALILSFTIFCTVSAKVLLYDILLLLRGLFYNGYWLSARKSLLGEDNRSLQSVRNTIHKNLSASLAMAYVVFLIGISRTEHQIACTVSAAVLYYLLLVAFLWMLMEGIQLYILLVQIFPRGEGFKKHYYAISWGFPAALTIVLCSSYPNGFGNAEFCWLSVKDHFIWAFVIPVLIIVVINTVFLGMTFKIVVRNSSIIARDHEMRKTVDKIGYWAKGSIGLVPLLGITWLFGVLYINEDSLVMAYLFTFFNSFQGLFIFIFYCCMNDKVKEDFKNRMFPMYRSNSHSSGNSKRNSRLSFTAVQMPWQRQPTTTTIPTPIRDPTLFSRSATGTFTRRQYQDVVREDPTSPDYDPAVLYSFSRRPIGKENTEFRCSGHSSDSRDSKSGLMIEETCDEGIGTGHRPCTSRQTPESEQQCTTEQPNGHTNGHANGHIPMTVKSNGHVPTGNDRVSLSRRNRSSPDIRYTDDFGSYEPDEFEERILQEIERNARRAKSTERINCQRYNHTVYV